MDLISKLEIRFKELIKKQIKSKEEIQEKERVGIELAYQLDLQTNDLIEELKGTGLNITSIWDLVNTKQPYPSAINILIEHLPKKYHDRNKEGIVRALTVKEAKGKASKALILEYENTPVEKDDLRWVIGNAIATVMTIKDIPWVFSAVQDKNNGISRGQLIKAVASVKSKEAENILIKLADDEVVGTTAIQALGKKNQKIKNRI